MAKTREIKGRIRAVANIQRITKTMQMIATARFQAAQKRAVASQPYTRKIAELVGELASAVLGAGSTIRHPLLTAPQPRVGKELLLVLSSNRGLAGAYNASVLRAATAFLRGHTDRQIDLEVVGRKGLAYFRFGRVPVAAFHSQFTDRPAYEDVERLAERYMNVFAQREYDAVHVAYMAFHSAARQSPTVATLLPMQAPAAPASGQAPRETPQYDLTPSAAVLLDELLPATVKTQLFQAFNEAVVSEQVARMVAMKSATDAAGKMRKELTRRYNRARQTAITTELTEIIGGAAGLE